MSISLNLGVDYITTLKIRQIQNEAELWDVVKTNQKQNTKTSDIMVFTALLKINNLKFLNNSDIQVSDTFKDENTFLEFSKPFIELQSSIAMSSSITDDCINLFNAVVNGYVDQDFRCPTTKTINKYISYCNNNDKESFLYSLESFIRGSAANNTNLIFDAENIDYFDTFEQDTLSLLIDEETKKELAEMGEKEEEKVVTSLFADLEVKNLKKAGNQYPLKKAKKEQDTGSLFNLVGAA